MDQFERAATRAIVTCGPKEAVERLGVNADDGLAAQEVDRRRQISGPNELAKTEEETACAKFLEQLKERRDTLTTPGGALYRPYGEDVHHFWLHQTLVRSGAD